MAEHTDGRPDTDDRPNTGDTVDASAPDRTVDASAPDRTVDASAPDRTVDASAPDRTVDADVVVVGCGPGGAVLSYLLARSGVDVALVERESTFQREYRGFGWNPGVVRLFDEMDLLADVLALAHETVTDGSFSLYGRRVSVLDFDLLDTDYPYALLMEQPALLELLVDRASAYEGFDFYPSTTVTDLWTDENSGDRDAVPVGGVVARDRSADETVGFEGRCVVGADGRYSAVRERAGIGAGLFDSPIDLVWFKLPSGAVETDTQGQIARDGVLVHFGLGAGELQVGYPIHAGTWSAIRESGFPAFRERVAAVDPGVAAAMAAHLDGFADTTLLDVAPGLAPEWTRDGLVLLGDAAHVASPLGAQGNPLAVEDAVVAHDRLVRALDGATGQHGSVEGDGPLPRSCLRAYEARRRPTVERVIGLQRRAADNLAFWLEYGRYVPPPLVRGATALAGAVVPRSGLLRRAVESFALGDRSVSVAREQFVD
ncbi:FAD-dependent monooxygenase [Halobaculum limi]|uniref:FAD-dependent monooxygenase n=1 Tax=Halobaculum limi TaxID=3031916 RepID=UPI0024062179|nr:FAD-dependent monooxygenase [Halobaculum sp. YSMS11]